MAAFAEALAARPGLRMIAVVPAHPDQEGRLTAPMNLLGRIEALDVLRRAGGDRFAVYGVENHAGTPVYVHAKVCVIDDVWAAVGSDNVNRRSWTHDSELSCAVLDEEPDLREPYDPGGLGDGARAFARDLRLRLGARAPGRRTTRAPCATRPPPSARSPAPRRPWTPGTAPAAPARARRAGCVPTPPPCSAVRPRR